jgi:hypothetical protein
MHENNRDCYSNKGTCNHEVCECKESQTGLHCQIKCTTEEMKNLNELRKKKNIQIEEDIRKAEAPEIVAVEAVELRDPKVKADGVKQNELKEIKEETKEETKGEIKGEIKEEEIVGDSSDRKKPKGKIKRKLKPGAQRKKRNLDNSNSRDDSIDGDKGNSILDTSADKNRDAEKSLQAQERHKHTEEVEVKKEKENNDNHRNNIKIERKIVDENSGIDDRKQTASKVKKPWTFSKCTHTYH